MNRSIGFDEVRTKDGFTVNGNTSNGEKADGTLERATREEAFPARLPLPDLRDLPDNLWKHSDVPVSGDSFTAGVPKHGVVLLRVDAGSVRSR